MNETTLIIVGFGIAQSIFLGVLVVICVQLARHVMHSSQGLRDDVSEMVLADIKTSNLELIQEEVRAVKHSLFSEIKMEREGILTLLIIDFESRVRGLMDESRWGELDGPLSAVFQFAGSVSREEAVQVTVLGLCRSLVRKKDSLTTSSKDDIVAYLASQSGPEAERLRKELEKTSEPA